ncbi:MAG TPA: guanylate kinase [Candidatus Krumholzibacteria bacterium]|nr:guanylate kinase [Candidatus Krumholzibacteria bacterium]
MIVLITGPSGAGKSSFIGRVMAADPRLAFSVSTTTRPIRGGETDGVEYDFVDAARFDQLLAEDAFVEWAVVHGNRYGTRRSHLDRMVAEGKIPVLDIDVQGGVQVIPKFGRELVSVFLFPPSWDELERRLRSRGTDAEETIALRLRNARHEVGFADHYTYWIVNDDLDAAAARMGAILTAEACRREAFPGRPL